MFTLLFISNGLIYNYNAKHLSSPQLPDFFTALYFVLTSLTTVGFSDITPLTAEGRLVVSASILAGIAQDSLKLYSVNLYCPPKLSSSDAAAGNLQCRARDATEHPAALFCYSCSGILK